MTNAQLCVIREMWEHTKESLSYSHPDINVIGEEIDAFESKIFRAFPDHWDKILEPLPSEEETG